MGAATHKDPSRNWLIFFFICFGLVVFAIGVFAAFTYNVNAPEVAPSGGHGMILPQDLRHQPYAQAALTV